MNRIQQLLPIWARPYPRQLLSTDIIGGLVVSVLVLPQSLAYAMLAGLPPQAGLYVSILPAIVYAWVGSSMTQAVGPVAVTAIMTFSVLSPLAEPASTSYMALAALLALMSGVMVLALGMMRMGFMSNLLSRPVVTGFIAGSALLIVLSQLKQLLGISVTGGSTWEQLQSLMAQLTRSNPVTLSIGAAGIVLLLWSRSALPRLLVRAGMQASHAAMLARLMPLVGVAGATVAVMALDLDHAQGVAVVGPVHAGLKQLALQMPDMSDLGRLVVPALILAFIGTVQNITMAQALALRHHERVDANRELVGLGLSNIAASLSGGMPVGGGLSRSAVNVAAGSRTPLASIVAGLSMLAMVAAGTSAFTRIPLAMLAASIVVAAIHMIDLAELRRAWAYDRADAWALVATAGGVLALGFQMGIVLGIALSLITLLYRASLPHIAVVGRIDGTEHFRNVERHGVQLLPGVVFLRIDESIFFGNLRAVETRLMSEVARTPQARAVVLIMSAVNNVDLTGLEGLTEMQKDLQDRGIELHLAEVKGPVQDRLASTPLWRALSGRIHLSTHAAFEQLQGS